MAEQITTLNLRVPEQFRRNLKIEAAKRSTTSTAIVIAAVTQYLHNEESISTDGIIHAEDGKCALCGNPPEILTCCECGRVICIGCGTSTDSGFYCKTCLPTLY
ncbi:MAG: hypothetical protein WC340_18535 [Kiritimatiellia bacterium]